MNHCNATRFYASLDAFYAADPRRGRSHERDFGLRWRGRRGVLYRAAWIRETREVYVVTLGHPLRGGGTVEVAERRFGLGELSAGLAGYRDVCGRPGSLGWLLDRLRHPPRPTRARP